MKISGAGDPCGVGVMKLPNSDKPAPCRVDQRQYLKPNSELLSLFPERLKHVLGSDCKVPQYKKVLAL